jgi:3-oxoacyl-[acyl-carrier protein] reductase
VTGAARGIGAVIAQTLHGRGLNVVLADVDAEAVAESAQRLGLDGALTLAVGLDVREETDFRRALATAVDRFGRVDVLVNNAALIPSTPFWEITREEWDEVFSVNLRGAYFGCRVLGEHMRDFGFGRIVNIASLAGQWGKSPTGVHYAASKAGLIGLTRVVATEFAPYGVTVNAVAPAAIDGSAVQAMPSKQIRSYVERTIPVGRLGEPAEVGELVAFLASDSAGFVTGATFDINGGALMR